MFCQSFAPRWAHVAHPTSGRSENRKQSLRFARQQLYNFLRAPRERNIKYFSALRAKSYSQFSLRVARKQTSHIEYGGDLFEVTVVTTCILFGSPASCGLFKFYLSPTPPLLSSSVQPYHSTTPPCYHMIMLPDLKSSSGILRTAYFVEPPGNSDGVALFPNSENELTKKKQKNAKTKIWAKSTLQPMG